MSGNVKVLKSRSSPFGLRVVWALKLKDVKYDYVDEDLNNKSPLLLQYNPVHKRIPVIVHNEKPISESLVILEYIDETWKQSPLLPPDPFERARARFWARFSDDKVMESLWTAFAKDGQEHEEAMKQIPDNLKFLEEELKGNNYFGGEAIGFTDLALGWLVYLVPACDEIIGSNLIDRDQFPALSAWICRFKSAPIISGTLPPHEELVAHLLALRAKNHPTPPWK